MPLVTNGTFDNLRHLVELSPFPFFEMWTIRVRRLVLRDKNAIDNNDSNNSSSNDIALARLRFHEACQKLKRHRNIHPVASAARNSTKLNSTVQCFIA